MNTRFFEQLKFYFNKWPNVESYSLQGTDYRSMNFLHRWTFREHIKNNVAVYSLWTIRDNDTPFSISERLYKSTHHYWIIMMLNDIIDIDFRWPLSEEQLVSFVDSKYGAENRNAIHHWESKDDGLTPIPEGEILNDGWSMLPDGHVVDATYIYGKESISNYDFEDRLNEERRQIRLLKPEFLQPVLDEKRQIIDTEFNKNKR